jgi:hypothetical protein
VLTKDATVASIAAAPRWIEVTLADRRALRLTDASMILMYRARARRETGNEYGALVASAYVQRKGQWQLAFHQQTPEGN